MQSVVRGVLEWVTGLERGPDNKEGGPGQEGGRRRTRWVHPLPTWPVSPVLVAKRVGSPCILGCLSPNITISSGPHFFLKCALVWVVNDTVNLNYKLLRGKKST